MENPAEQNQRERKTRRAELGRLGAPRNVRRGIDDQIRQAWMTVPVGRLLVGDNHEETHDERDDLEVGEAEESFAVLGDKARRGITLNGIMQFCCADVPV